MIGEAGYFLSEAGQSLWRQRRSAILATVTIASALFVLGTFLVLLTNVDRLVAEWRSAAEFSVYLADDIDDGDRRALEALLRSNGAVAAVEFVSKAGARDRFARAFPDFAPASRVLSSNPFPASLEVRLRGGSVETDATGPLAARVARMPGVTDVRYDRQWMDRVTAAATAVRTLGLAVSAILVLAAALTVTNVVRLALHARRDEIEIMALVGAPMAFIRGPFIVEGLLQGGAGAVLALAALAVATRVVGARLLASGLVPMHAPLAFLPAAAMAALVGGGVVVGCLAGWIATRRLAEP